MENKPATAVSYFPGCSLATTAKENNQSLKRFCRKVGVELVELQDWNCCGSSSAHSINSSLAQKLAERNLALAPAGRPLLVACPSCMLRLGQTHLHLKQDPSARERYERTWGRPVDQRLEVLHFFGLLERIDLAAKIKGARQKLGGLRFAPYYGCMLARPPEMRDARDYYGILERTLAKLGAEPVLWPYASRCCGTFLSAVRPDVVTPMVDQIMQGAADCGAECLVTACAMCHMNLEIRCSMKQPIPVLHFSELLALATGDPGPNSWFARHLVDPRPLLRRRRLIA